MIGFEIWTALVLVFLAVAPAAYYKRKKQRVEARIAELSAGANETYFEERRSLETYRGWEDVSARKIWTARALAVLGLLALVVMRILR